VTNCALNEVKSGTHIYAVEHALSAEFCHDTISRFVSATNEQYPGRIGQSEVENLDIKQSTDLVISGKTHWQDVDRTLFASLASALARLRSQHPFFQGRLKDYGYAIKRTLQGEFFHWQVDLSEVF